MRLRLPHIDARRHAPAIGLVALYAYLTFHAFSGSQGLFSWMQSAEEAELLQARLAVKSAQHEALQARVDALSNDALDLDALDIAARRDLFVSGANEITIWLDP